VKSKAISLPELALLAESQGLISEGQFNVVGFCFLMFVKNSRRLTRAGNLMDLNSVGAMRNSTHIKRGFFLCFRSKDIVTSGHYFPESLA
jgi:hypothetical protein